MYGDKENTIYLYSISHGVRSKIDYLFTFNLDKHRLKDCTIKVTDISDHLDYKGKDTKKLVSYIFKDSIH